MRSFIQRVMAIPLWRVCLLASLVSPVVLLGQASLGNGNVTGLVSDQSGAAVPDATVTLTDTSTNISVTAQTNSAGLYVFRNVNIGTYDLSVEKSGFRKSVIAQQQVTTGTNLNLNVTLQVGSTNETIEVKDVAGAELQTENATMGTTLGGNAILQLPTIGRDVSSLVFYQPTAAPTFNGAEGNTTSGNIAGNPADQNTFLLDGGLNTSDLDGDNATYVGHNGQGVMPTPAESVEEFHVDTNNQDAAFSLSSAGSVMVTTKRGTSEFHGAAYDFYQADWLNSNDWGNNFRGIPKPKGHFNRFGGAIGGPLGPSFLGGKTYFYTNYEGLRYPRSGPFEATVPSATLRQGIIQERDASGSVVQYNLATSTACGATGGQPCDPRHIGINPYVSQIWNKYEPACNDLNWGDHGLNTCGYFSNLAFPLSNDFGVFRLDHDFGSKWRFFSSYRMFRQIQPTTDEVDIGGILPGDTFGNPATASTDINQPRFLVLGITGTISPSLTNEFNASYLLNKWAWLRPGAGYPQLPGLVGSMEIGGENTNYLNSDSAALIPLNTNTQQSRARAWGGHDYDYRDNVSWLKGTHLVQFGGELLHQYWRFDRYDSVIGGITSLVDNVSNSSIADLPAYEPMPCGNGVAANCLPAGELSQYNTLAADVLGLTSGSNIVVTRSGANLTANPLGTPVHSNVYDNTWSVFFNDSWHIKPNLTLTYGVNYQIEYPPTDANGVQDLLVNGATNQPMSVQSYLNNTLVEAQNGYAYAPTIGFSPIGAVKGLNYPYKPFYGGISPRGAIAWTPNINGGFLGKLFGDKSTVIRAGYGRYYTRNLGIDLVSNPTLGDAFLQPVSCIDPTIAGACTASHGTNALTAFRMGIDGTNPPVGAHPQTLAAPVEPGISTAYSNYVSGVDSNFQPGSTDSIDFSIQRQFKGNFVLEVGYVGVYARNLYQGIDLSNVPWMMNLGGQTFANAYDNLYFALAGNKPITPQPFFETALRGTSYCSGQPNCTAGMVAKEQGNILTQSVTSMWSDLDGSMHLNFPASAANSGNAPFNLLNDTQCLYCYFTTSMGYSNYNAATVSLQKRGKNLNMLANFTYGRALGTLGLNQAYISNNANDPWNLGVDYGPQYFDRKFTANILGTYNLPFGPGQRWSSNNKFLNQIIGGWLVSPIFSFGSGLPLSVFTGSYQEWGNGIDGAGCNAVPLSGTGYSNTPVYGVGSTGIVASNDNATNGGTGVNLFGNPTAVYNNFRPNLVGIDGSCGGGGILRGMPRWNLDLGLTKDTHITERVGFQIFAQAFNVLNHMQWSDPGAGTTPSLNLQDPQDFGVLSSQYGALALGAAPGASAEYTRIIQLGLRLYF